MQVRFTASVSKKMALAAFDYLPEYSAAQPAWQAGLTAAFSVEFPWGLVQVWGPYLFVNPPKQ